MEKIVDEAWLPINIYKLHILWRHMEIYTALITHFVLI